MDSVLDGPSGVDRESVDRTAGAKSVGRESGTHVRKRAAVR